MGYAMMYKQRITLSKNLKDKFFNACQMIAYCILGKSLHFIYKSNSYKGLTTLAIPLGVILSIRRAIQFNVK